MDLISRYRELMKSFLPPGMAWTRDILSYLHRFLDGLAVEFYRIHERGDDLLDEMEPTSTVELLSEWESAWGLPDQCTGSLSTLNERRAALLAKMAHVGQQTPSFFVRVAATLGYDITVEENVDGSPYVWRIISNIITNPVYARAGSARAGDPIRSWGADMLECAMRALNPAHLQLLVAYIEADFSPALVSATIWPDGLTVSLVFNQALSHGTSYSDADFNIDASLAGGDIHMPYLSGNGTATHLYMLSVQVRVGETVALDFTGDYESLVRSDGAYLAPITGRFVQNNSEQTEAPPSIVSKTISASGNILTLVFSEALAQGAGYLNSDFNLDASSGGSDIGIAYVSGNGTDTHVYAISKTIRLGETVNLDYNGRPDGLEDANGNDLSAILDSEVTNHSTENYSDIIFWDGLEGTITSTSYESTNYDHPAFHVATINPPMSFSTAFKVVGTKSLYLNGRYEAFKATIPSLNMARGRIGFHVRPDSDLYGGLHTFVRLQNNAETAHINLIWIDATTMQVNVYRSGGASFNQNYTVSVPALAWTYIEMIWDFTSFGFTLRVNGNSAGQVNYPMTADFPDLLTKLLIGSSTYAHIDNLAISNDPTRDLYPLSLLTAYPGA